MPTSYPYLRLALRLKLDYGLVLSYADAYDIYNTQIYTYWHNFAIRTLTYDQKAEIQKIIHKVASTVNHYKGYDI